MDIKKIRENVNNKMQHKARLTVYRELNKNHWLPNSSHKGCGGKIFTAYKLFGGIFTLDDMNIDAVFCGECGEVGRRCAKQKDKKSCSCEEKDYEKGCFHCWNYYNNGSPTYRECEICGKRENNLII